jgi:hypothetical protein
MTTARVQASILLIDDGELDEVASILEAQDQPYTRLRGGQIPLEIAPPRDLLIVTPRRVERIRRGSPPDAAPGYPVRIVAVQEDSPSMRRTLRRSGLQFLVRLPTNPEIWRLLIARALYRGHERREDSRIAVGSPVAVGDSGEMAPQNAPSAILIDLSNRGCRLQTTENLSIDDAVTLTIPSTDEDCSGDGQRLILRGRVRRLVQSSESLTRTLAVSFDEDLPASTRTRLTGVINRWASGPHSLSVSNQLDAPAIPPCQLPSLPDLTLDDETDPPVRNSSEVQVQLEVGASSEPAEPHDAERRSNHRGRFESPVVLESPGGPVVLIGRDLAPGGMRVERVSELRVADRFRIALHGLGSVEPFIVNAEVIRDDGEEGFALAFPNLDPQTSREIEKLVACLPTVESLEDGEIDGMGAILSQILRD